MVARSLQFPPRLTTTDGRRRVVGLEFEFTGISLDDAAGAVQRRFGGRLEQEAEFCFCINETFYGSFRVELDSSLLKRRKYKEVLHSMGITGMEGIDRALAAVVSKVVPYEISTPPIPMEDIHQFDLLREDLRTMGAKGTSAALYYAFGLHINVEAASLEHQSLGAILRAFALLYPHLKQRVSVDIARRLSPYVNKFDAEYVHRLMAPDYPGSMQQLLNDYLEFNPTRNRALDMLPALSWVFGPHIIPAGVKVAPRPAYHYRMPNCLIDLKSWTIAEEWNTWVQVERLAEDRPKLEEMAREYLSAEHEDGGAAWENSLLHYLRA